MNTANHLFRTLYKHCKLFLNYFQAKFGVENDGHFEKGVTLANMLNGQPGARAMSYYIHTCIMDIIDP